MEIDGFSYLPITSKTVKVYPFEVLVLKDESGLQRDSKIKCNQIRTVDKRRPLKYLGSLPASKLREVERALLIHLGIGFSQL